MMVYWAMTPEDTINVFDTLIALRVPFSVRYRGGLILVGVRQDIESSVCRIMSEFTKAWEGIEDATY